MVGKNNPIENDLAAAIDDCIFEFGTNAGIAMSELRQLANDIMDIITDHLYGGEQ